MPKGPAGQFALYLPFQHSIMKYSKNQKLAKDFLKWLHQDANYEKWFQVNEGYSVGSTKKWEEHPMWTRIDKPLQVFRQAARASLMLGYPGAATVKWAEGELKKIYEA
jgi:multiple sugar transport system substrate-binding protein